MSHLFRPAPPAPLARRALVALIAFFAALTLATAGAHAGTTAATLGQVFGGPIAEDTGQLDVDDGTGYLKTHDNCRPGAVADRTTAASFTDYCIAFHVDNPMMYREYDNVMHPNPNAVDLKSQVIDTPSGFAGFPDDFPACTDAQFAKDTDADVTCPAAAQVGDAVSGVWVAADLNGPDDDPTNDLNLGLTEDGGTPVPGRVYNLARTGNEVSRLGIVLDPSVFSPLDQPKVKIVVRITLRPGPDVGLRSIIDNMPSTVGVDLLGDRQYNRALALEDFAMRLWGKDHHLADMDPSDDVEPPLQTRPFAFVGSDCSRPQITQVSAVAYDGTPSQAASRPYVLRDCDSANAIFQPTASITTTEQRPDVPTETAVKLSFGQDAPAGFVSSAVKQTTVTLPEGLALSGQIASGAGGLKICTSEQFDRTGAAHSTCPAGSAVGDVQIKSPLLRDPMVGKAFLGPQPKSGALPDLLIEAELGTAADAPRVKLTAGLELDAQHRLVASLDNLPELLVSEFLLTFRGGDHAAIVTPPVCGTTQGALSAASYGKPSTPVRSSQSYTVDQDCAPRGFAPTVAFGLDNPQAGGSSPFTTTVSRPDRTPRLSRVAIDLPAGVLATLRGVPECGTADAAAGNCPQSSKVGTISTRAGVGPAPFVAPGDVYLTQRANGAVAGLSFRVPVAFGDVDLGVLNVPARVDIRSEDVGLRVTADVPERFAGIPLNIQSMSIRLDRDGFPLSPTSCAPPATASSLTSVEGTVATATASLKLTGCDSLKFAPEFAAAVNGATGNKGRPNLQVQFGNAGGAAMRQIFLTLPKGIAVDLKQISRACSIAAFKASSCPASAKIGNVNGLLTITDESLFGDLFLLEAAPGKTLPGLGLAFRGRYAANVAGSSQVDAKTGQLVTQFESVPDLPLKWVQVDVKGGTGGPLVATKTLCDADSVNFAARLVSHSGPTANRTVKSVCGAVLGAAVPKVTASLKGLRKGKPALSLKLSAPAGSAKISRIDTTLPKGWALAKSTRGVRVTQLAKGGRATTKRVTDRLLRVTLRKAHSKGAKLTTSSGAITVKSASRRKTKNPVVIKVKVTYGFGKTVTVPVLVTPR